MKIKIKQPNFAILLFEKGITQLELAKKSSISKTTINGVYNGRTCSMETAGKIATVLNVDVKDILED